VHLDLHFASISELSAFYRSGDVSPVEVVDALLARIDQYGAQTRAYITVTAERARAEAKAAEEMLSNGADLGPLHGIPIALKDLFYTEGVRTTWGAKALEDFVPDTSSTVAQRLAQAGAVLIGKTNMVELAFGPYGLNPHYDTPPNPWDSERVPGGSSSGSGVAVATGLATAAIGTDTGGSIRIPASFCGIVGLKPTLERVSRAGVMPLSWTLDSMGPLTRSVEDAALVFEAIAGADPADLVTLNQPVVDVVRGLKCDVKGLRVGLVCDPFFDGADAEVVAAVEAAAKGFEDLGVRVVEFELPEAREELNEELEGRGSSMIMSVEGYTCHRDYISQHGEVMDPRIRARIENGASFSAVDYAAVLQRREQLRASVCETLADVDAAICPTMLTPAPRIVDVDAAPVRLTTRLVNFLGLCAVSVPCGWTEGNLPIGLQIIGKPFDEARILQLGYAYEQTTHSQRPPGF
jgi:aspartyl-tRNA(Asn)/glutamyl-tRNA(Gln) amidotransferase subunit A